MMNVGLILCIGALLAIIVLLHWLSLRGVMLIVNLARRLPVAITESKAWVQSRTARSKIADRYPTILGFIRGRITPRRFSGLPLTLLAGAAVYLAALFSG